MQTQISNTIKYVKDIPFIQYKNDTYSFIKAKQFVIEKSYRRFQPRLDNNFITNYEKEYKKYIMLLSAYAEIYVMDTNLAKIINDIKTYLNEFISKYNENKSHIDNDKDEDDEYIYSSGKTTLTYDFDLVLVVNDSIKENEKGDIIKNKNFSINYKLRKVSCVNERR